jgi:hypothetical protein
MKSCPFEWWKKQEYMFHIVDFLTCQVLGIIKSQIEIKKFFLKYSLF